MKPTEADLFPKAGREPTLFKAATLIGGVTVFSKFIGFLRDWGIMVFFGASLVTDAYYAAFQLPAFAIVLLGGLGGPFHTTTVSILSRFIKPHKAPEQETQALVSTGLTITALVFTLLAALIFWFASPIMGIILQGGSPELIQLATVQLKIMSPCILFGGLVGIFYGLSNLNHGFFWPSLSPTALSLAILIALFFFSKESAPMLLAWATLVGSFLQLLIQFPDFFKYQFSFRPALNLKHPELKKASELLFPATVGTTVGQLVTYVDMFFAAGLGVGGWSAVTLSNRLIQLPLGVLQTALLVPIFPRFSRAAADGNVSEIKHNFKTSVIVLWLISIPLLVILLFFTKPLIQLVFQHGQFTETASNLVSTAVVYQAFQILPYFARDSITRIFYAYQDAKTPLMVGLLAIGLKAFLNMLLVPMYGVGGITAAITLVTAVNMVLLGILSKKHIADLGFKEMALPFLKLAVAGTVMGSITWIVYTQVGARLSSYIAIMAAIYCGIVSYIITINLLQIHEFKMLQDRIFLKRNKKKTRESISKF
ncbi:MAG: murein biosynthesis integral membrane protein MurJ [Cyanobacteria bacterium P01_H01_bin.74]